jgi:rod shape determining protein RodA
MKFKFNLPKTIDWILYILPIILTLGGLAVIYSITYYNGKISLFYSQIIFAIIGFSVMIFLTFWDYRNLKGLAIYLYLIGLALLVAVLFFGKSALGATRWIDLRFFQLQPSELMKAFLIILIARYLSDKIGQVRFRDIIVVGVLTLIPAFLIMRQPDLGTVTVLVVGAISLIFASKLSRKQIFALIGIALISIPILWFSLKDYQKQRVFTFLNPTSDQYGSGYNVFQSTITIGNGGFLGRGLGHGAQSQLNFLPVAHTDFIFAGLAEASGFVGSMILIIIFIVLIIKIIGVAKISKDNFGMMLAVGFAAILFFQMAVNIAMNLGLAPVTGIPLPFVSHGGTSLVLSFAMIGILQSIYLRHKKITF